MHKFTRRSILAAGTLFCGSALGFKADAQDGVAVKTKAPDFVGVDGWINSEPLTIESLKGKPLLIDFWTYACINCVRTLPHLVKWHDMFAAKGLVIVGIHTPEFPFERDNANVKEAVELHKIRYPVVQDNRYQTWRAYEVQYWPTMFLVNKDGYIVNIHEGEGDYEKTEALIASLL